MKLVHMSPEGLAMLIEHRRRTGAGRLDECWEGVWHLTDPPACHQSIAGRLYRIFADVVEDTGLGSAWISINVTDREVGWIDNHRCPDGAVILAGNAGRGIGASQVAFLGGPDLVLEVLSDDDEARDKLPFHARLGVREVLLVDPDAGPELWRLARGEYRREAGRLESTVTQLAFKASSAALEVSHAASDRAWTVPLGE